MISNPKQVSVFLMMSYNSSHNPPIRSWSRVCTEGHFLPVLVLFFSFFFFLTTFQNPFGFLSPLLPQPSPLHLCVMPCCSWDYGLRLPVMLGLLALWSIGYLCEEFSEEGLELLFNAIRLWRRNEYGYLAVK